MKRFWMGVALAVMIPLTVMAPVMANEPMTDEKAMIAKGGVLVPAAELEALYLKNMVMGKTPSGYTFRTDVKPDKTLPANSKRGAGTFSAPAEGTTCLHFPDLWEGKPRCWRHYRLGEKHKMYLTDGTFSADLYFEPK
ncbi:MAG: hypothetical protein OQJ99_02760 [Rhodospirillales bacterium]|nr:hypothetical protein [Rhodospirillales bacterium]MCW8862792.1 hypothetical protein [Rhodospirillales bacterium]MCW8953205.1 hypothetical protein [Rhodospirillales bacterium]MCW8969818.1 hypothetical protein [Rhodospirillales bacterium]MCW9002703.1 hypothetical protein [Rhodospirillales bacterium]